MVCSLRTASAWVLAGEYFPFMVGPDRTGEQLGVVRLGGHIQSGETPWQCAVREVKEEAGLDIQPLPPPATYRLRQETLSTVLWTDPDVVQPILIGDHSQYYLARAEGSPSPGAEARGLLLLSHDDVLDLACRHMTLGEYLDSGRRAIFRENLDPLPTGAPLRPMGPQLLAKILHIHPRLGIAI